MEENEDDLDKLLDSNFNTLMNSPFFKIFVGLFFFHFLLLIFSTGALDDFTKLGLTSSTKKYEIIIFSSLSFLGWSMGIKLRFVDLICVSICSCY